MTMNSKINSFIEGSIKVRYLYSACIVTTTPDVSILHDPWFTQGVYDGSWYHFPRVRRPLNKIGDVDLIFISHIHPDHYDPQFLRKYFERFGEKKILIAGHNPNFLYSKMVSDGFSPQILENVLKIGGTSIQIISHSTGSISDIDSAVIVKFVSKKNRQHCVVNMNDIVCDSQILQKVKNAAGDIDILLCGFTGAGPYPQTFYDLSDSALKSEVAKKKNLFFERYISLTKFMNSKINVPFAGQYLLGGRFIELNDYRGVADAVEICDFDKKAVVLGDNGGEIDTADLIPTRVRKKKYSRLRRRSREFLLRNKKMSYESLIDEDDIPQLKFKRLLSLASKNAIKKSECIENFYYCIKLPGDFFAVINVNRLVNDDLVFVDTEMPLPTPRSEITIDPRYLFGLLIGIYSWNNAEVGSHFNVMRVPNEFNRNTQRFLWHLCI